MNRLQQSHWLGRGSLAFMFAYHGLVPKLNDAFNPVTLNVAGMALCTFAWITRPDKNVNTQLKETQ